MPLVEKWFLGYCPPSEIRKLEDKAERPENVAGLKPLKVNAERYYAIHREGVEADRSLQYVSTAVAKSAQPLVNAWAQIFAADAAFLDANPEQKECILQVTPDVKLNLSQIRELLSLGLMLAGAANVQLAQCRRAGFKFYLHYDYHGLLHHSNPLAAAQLFGGTVKEKIGDLEKIKQVVRKVRCKRGRKPPQYRRSRADFVRQAQVAEEVVADDVRDRGTPTAASPTTDPPRNPALQPSPTRSSATHQQVLQCE